MNPKQQTKKQVAKLRKHKVTITQDLIVTSHTPITEAEDKKEIARIKKDLTFTYRTFNTGWSKDIKSSNLKITVE